MANIHEIKLRIKSIQETRQITRAMKLISAFKLRKARQQLEETLPFFNKVKSTLADILLHSANIESRFLGSENGRKAGKKGYMILSGDKGLAGGYNHNIIRFAEKQLEAEPEAVLFVAGLMGRNYFIRKNYTVNTGFDDPVQNPTIGRAMKMAQVLLALFEREELDEIYLIFTQAASTLLLTPQIMKLLPLDPASLREDLKDLKASDEDLVYEPSPAAVFDVLIPKYLKGIVYGAWVEAFTSEQSARMAAMDHATSNADEMLEKLALSYNRARQAAITQEISEIVGGATTLK